MNDTFQSNEKFPVMDDELSRALRARHPFFRRFTAAELASVAALGVVRTIGTGKHICAQGEDGTTVFIVVSGVAMVFIEERRRDDGVVKRKVGELVPGQTSGEECVLSDGETRRARTIIASPPGVRVIELGRDSFDAAFARRPALVDHAANIWRVWNPSK